MTRQRPDVSEAKEFDVDVTNFEAGKTQNEKSLEVEEKADEDKQRLI